MTSEIRANTLKNRVGLGTVSFTNTGPVVSGIVTIANSTSEGVRLEDNAGVGGSLKITTPSGYVSIGAGNAAFVHINTDRGSYYFQKRIIVDEGIIGSYDENLTLQSPLNTNRVTINKDTGLFSILNDLDVDGHTNLDNVSIAGVTSVASLTSGRVVTVGTAGKLQDSANLTFDGAEFDINNAGGSARLYLISGNSADSSIYFGRQNDGATGGIRYEHTNDSLKFMGYNNADKMIIDSSGNVLVGTTDTSVYNNNSGNGIVLRGGQAIDVARSNDLQLTLNRMGNDGPHIAFYKAGGVKSYISTRNNAFCIDVNGTNERLRITSAGLIRMGNGAEGNTEAHVTAAIFQNTTGAATILKLGNTNTPSSANNRAIEFCDGAGGTEGSSKYTYARIKAERTGGSNAGRLMFFTKPDNSSDATEKLRIDSSGRVLIGSSSNNSNKVGDSALQVYTQDRKHPAIRVNAANANGFTMLSDAYQADESQVNIGVSYSSAKLVLSTSVKPSDTTADEYLSSQDTFSARPTALTMNHQGILAFLNTDTNATTTTDSAVSLTERFRIRADGTVRIGGDLYTDTAIMMTLRNRAGTGSQIQFHGTGTGTGNSDGLRVGYNGTGGQMWLFENGGYLRFATSNNERVRIDEYGAITHTRGDNTTRWDVEFRQTGGISDGNYGGIKWTQNSTGGVHLAGIKLAYANTGRPDLVFSQRNRGGGTGEQEILRLDSNGEIIKTRATTRYVQSSVKSIEFPVYLSSGTTHTIVTLGGSYDVGFVAFATFEYIGLYAYAGNQMSGGVRRAYTRRINNNTAWRDFDNQVSENYGENYRPDIVWDNGVLKITTPGSTQITGFIRVVAHSNNNANVQITRNIGI